MDRNVAARARQRFNLCNERTHIGRTAHYGSDSWRMRATSNRSSSASAIVSLAEFPTNSNAISSFPECHSLLCSLSNCSVGAYSTVHVPSLDSTKKSSPSAASFGTPLKDTLAVLSAVSPTKRHAI